MSRSTVKSLGNFVVLWVMLYGAWDCGRTGWTFWRFAGHLVLAALSGAAGALFLFGAVLAWDWWRDRRAP